MSISNIQFIFCICPKNSWIFNTEQFKKKERRFEPLWDRTLAEHSGSVGRVLDWGSKVCKFESHRGWSHCCVLEQDTLSAAYYWFNPGRPVPTWRKKCWLGCKESNQTNKQEIVPTLLKNCCWVVKQQNKQKRQDMHSSMSGQHSIHIYTSFWCIPRILKSDKYVLCLLLFFLDDMVLKYETLEKAGEMVWRLTLSFTQSVPILWTWKGSANRTQG